MSAQAVKAAGKVAGKAAEGHVLKTGAKRDPELYVCSSNHFSSRAPLPPTLINSYTNAIFRVKVLLGVMSGAFGLAGFYFGTFPPPPTSDRYPYN